MRSPLLSRFAATTLVVLGLIIPLSGPHASGRIAIHPAPDPFTLNSRDAVQAIWMIRRSQLLILALPGKEREIIYLEDPLEVEARYAGEDPAPPGREHARRYQLYLLGSPLDWENTFIRYRGEMVNLQTLFTYRNQKLPPGLRLRLPETP
ncbi:hypothetical protein SAMN05920897_11582 [Alkalispirochaeta americana]|uniref:Uncharacterized protein n=2 Tax=Alkalispirochaeta americana TaxID=159291 RepID=A0A1N6VTW1_9SPIO|nr:hypothetical protein SAMN05920897_11582 [Alkalispirochaeta americana]